MAYLSSKRMFACTCAGFGNYLARPLFRERHSPDMSEADATKLLHDALRVWFFHGPLLLLPCPNTD